MSKRIYVGNLPYKVTDSDLREMFEAHGAVSSATVIIDKFSGQSKGFGFVEMANDDEARNAIDGMNLQRIAGRAVTVNEARPKRDRSQQRRGGRW